MYSCNFLKHKIISFFNHFLIFLFLTFLFLCRGKVSGLLLLILIVLLCSTRYKHRSHRFTRAVGQRIFAQVLQSVFQRNISTQVPWSKGTNILYLHECCSGHTHAKMSFHTISMPYSKHIYVYPSISKLLSLYIYAILAI